MATFGYTGTGDNFDFASANEAFVGKYTIATGADVTKLTLRGNANSGTSNVKPIIYADNAGAPGAKIAVGSAVNITTTESYWDLPLVVTLAAGTYWIGVLPDATVKVKLNTNAAGRTSYKTSFTYASPADPFGTESGNDNGFDTAVYATYTVPAAGPSITGGTAAPVHQSTGNTLTGTGFGASQTGSAGAAIGGTGQTETAWGDTSITYTADRGVNLNGVAVNAVVTDSGGTPSANYALTGFQPPAGWSYVTLTSVWADPLERLQSSADLAIGNQVEWDDATIDVDDSGRVIWPPGTPDGYTFNFRVGVTGDGWGATEVATLNPASTGSGDNTRRLSMGLSIGL